MGHPFDSGRGDFCLNTTIFSFFVFGRIEIELLHNVGARTRALHGEKSTSVAISCRRSNFAETGGERVAKFTLLVCASYAAPCAPRVTRDVSYDALIYD